MMTNWNGISIDRFTTLTFEMFDLFLPEKKSKHLGC